MKVLILIGILAISSASPHHHHHHHHGSDEDDTIHPPWWHPRTPGGSKPGLGPSRGFGPYGSDSDEDPFTPPGGRRWNFDGPWTKHTTEKPRVTFPIYPSSSTSTTTTTTTTARPDPGSSTSKPIGPDLVLEACNKSCPSTAEHNPVCGTNNVTYGNMGKLECARLCGVDVQLKRKSPCGKKNNTSGGNNDGNNNENNAKKDDIAIQACMRNCPVTAEYNPVCGTNNVTYANPGRIECAINCGLPINILRRTSCNAPLSREEGIEICMRSCSVTTQYNPVCGTDNRTYDNEGRLECARNCGRNVQISRRSSCSVTGPDPRFPPNKNDNCKGNGNSNGNCNGKNPNPNKPPPKNDCNGKGNCNGNGSGGKTTTEIIACMQLCRTTLEVNPVCGTDGVTYSNPGHLLCAQSCGVDVKVRMFAPCLGSPIITPPPTPVCPTVTPTKVPLTIPDCNSKCMVSPELKPVCGTNGITYMNIESLLCMQKCGVDVQLLKKSACGTSTPRPTAATPPVWENTDRPTQPTVATEATPNPSNLQTCIKKCTDSQVYRPVCGTDGITYANLQTLQCAKRCGINVDVKKQSACVSGSKDENTTDNGLGFTIPDDILSGVFPDYKPATTPASKPTDDSTEYDLDERFGTPT